MDTDSPAADGPSAAAQVQAALGADRSGGDDAASTLVIAAPSVPDALDPLDGLTPLAARIVDDAVFEGLVRRTDTGWPWASPALADSCVLVPADVPRDVYCHLTPGMTFHDGSAVTAEDVEYSLAYWLDPRRGWLRDRHGLSSLKKIERVDGPPSRADAAAPPGFVAGPRDADHWFRVSFSEPHPLALQLIASMKIVPKASHRGRRRAFAKAPVGTGPMRVTVLEPDRVVLELRDDLVDSAPGGQGDRARRIVLRQINDGAEVLTLMRRGEVHIATELARTHVPEELAESGMAARFEAWLVSPPRYDVLIYNLRGGLQSGPRLRSALDAGLPRAAIASLLGGAPPLPIAAPVDIHDPTPIDLKAIARAGHSARWGAAGLVEDIDAAQDVQGAEALAAALDSLGWSMERGVRRRENNSLRLVLMWNGASGHGRQVASAIKSAWREQGVVVPYATASWSYLRGPLRRGEFDLALARMADASDADLYPYFHSRGVLNISGIVDAELDAALVAFRLAKTPLARREAETAVAQRLTALRPVSVLHAPTAITLVSRRVQGLRFIDDLPELSGAIRLLPHDRWTLSKR
ncbi:MAG: ABC transporter substrate-binding protein [Nannocystaceae bacterium]|nr:ABC transporter substrate-binding protein [Nannocystaceae bacterium]